MGTTNEKWIQALARNLTAANATPRCGAKTRSGIPCKSPAANGKKRCRMHGGTLGCGAPSGERNGRYKIGRYTKEAKATRHELYELMRVVREFGRMI